MTAIALIACCKSKDWSLEPKTPDKLYTGQLFQAQLAYARQRLPDEQIYILSAKYGLVGLSQPIHPYEQTLNGMDSAERFAWAWEVDASLRYHCSEAKTVWMMAGKKYQEYLAERLGKRDIEILRPHPAAYGYGQQVSWYQQQVEAVRYKTCECCGNNCAYFEDQKTCKPCWGEVRLTLWSEHGYVHACEGHEFMVDTGRYEYPSMVTEVK